MSRILLSLAAICSLAACQTSPGVTDDDPMTPAAESISEPTDGLAETGPDN